MKNKETKEILVYSCGYCAKMYRNKEDADLCHMDRTCKTCGKVIEKKSYHLNCDECRIKLEKEEELRLYEKATKMTYEEYETKYPGHMVVVDDEYYLDVDYALDGYKTGDNPIVWGTSKHFTTIDADSLVETFEEETGLEDFYLDSEAVKKLVEILKLWNDKYSQVTYYKDTDIVIVN